MSDEKWTGSRLCLCTHGYVCMRECNDSAVRLRSAQLRTRCSRHRGLNLPHSLLKLQPQFPISTVNLITYRSRDTQTHLCVVYTCMWLWIVCIFLSYFLCFHPYAQHHGCFISYHLLRTSTVITNSTGPQRRRLTTKNIQAYGLSEIVLIRLSKANCTFVKLWLFAVMLGGWVKKGFALFVFILCFGHDKTD